MRVLTISVLFLWTAIAAADVVRIDQLYVRTFGDAAKPAVVFVHGGPGFHAGDFEATTAQPLADRGFHVVVYDQRGQGRSAAATLNFTYEQYARDLKLLITSLGLKTPLIVAHSHGGPVAIEFEERYPDVASAIVLVSAPVNFWRSMEDLVANCTDRYQASNRPDLLAALRANFTRVASSAVGTPELIEPVANLFQHGLFGCRLYSPARSTPEALRLRAQSARLQVPTEMNSMPGFLLNEDYVYRDRWALVAARPGRYFGIYGTEDGLFTPSSLAEIEGLVGSRRLHIVREASQAVFIDQQDEFLSRIEAIASGL